jgi:hypothetical protein
LDEIGASDDSPQPQRGLDHELINPKALTHMGVLHLVWIDFASSVGESRELTLTVSRSGPEDL